MDRSKALTSLISRSRRRRTLTCERRCSFQGESVPWRNRRRTSNPNRLDRTTVTVYHVASTRNALLAAVSRASVDAPGASHSPPSASALWLATGSAGSRGLAGGWLLPSSPARRGGGSGEEWLGGKSGERRDV